MLWMKFVLSMLDKWDIRAQVNVVHNLMNPAKEVKFDWAMDDLAALGQEPWG